MFHYKGPARDMHFALHELLNVKDVLSAFADGGEWNRSIIDQTIEAAARFGLSELLPLNASGDLQGCRIDADGVTTPAGFAVAYRKYVEGGWPSLSCTPELGGQGAPSVVHSAVCELFYALNPGWTMFAGTRKAHTNTCSRMHRRNKRNSIFERSSGVVLTARQDGSWANPTRACATCS